MCLVFLIGTAVQFIIPGDLGFLLDERDFDHLIGGRWRG